MDLSGPWLLDDTALTHLDDLLIPEWQRLCATRQEAIEVDLNQRVNEYRQRNNGCEPDEQELRHFRERATISAGPKIRRMALRLKGRHAVVVESFREALRSAELIDQVPIGLELELDCAGVRASLEVGKYSDHLRLTISPESSQHARELFVTLRNWAVTHQPPLWQRLWGHLYGVHWFI